MTTTADFWNAPIGPYWSHTMTVRHWTYVEHSMFWLAIVLVLIAFSPALVRKQPKPMVEIA